MIRETRKVVESSCRSKEIAVKWKAELGMKVLTKFLMKLETRILGR